MKKLFVLLIALPALCFSQKSDKRKDITEDQLKIVYEKLPKVDGDYEFSEVVQLDSSYKKDDLYKNAKLFFTNAFKSAKEVLQYDDRAEGKVIGKGNVQVSGYQLVFLNMFSETRTINFTLELYCKDGKYKYRIYNISSDIRSVATGGSTPDRVTNYSSSIDQQYIGSQKGITKKMDRNLLYDSIMELQGMQSLIKESMSKKSSKDDF